MKSKFLCFVLIISMMILINGVAATNIGYGVLDPCKQAVKILTTKLLRLQLTPTAVVATRTNVAEEASSH